MTDDTQSIMNNTIVLSPEFLTLLSSRAKNEVVDKNKIEVCKETQKRNGYDENRIAKPADSIRNYDEFKAICDYFLQKEMYLYYALWVCGVCFGIRMSDLRELKFKHIYDDNMNFRERVVIKEKKTHKTNNLLITEAIREGLSLYLEKDKTVAVGRDMYIFQSKMASNKAVSYIAWYKQITRAATELGISPEVHISTHSMRKTFTNIVSCCDDTKIDRDAITKAQILLNHSNQMTTFRYLGAFQEYKDECRKTVSDFCLGKTKQKELRISIIRK